MTNTDTTTEEKIKQAARELFQEKGYSATKTRDIAERSGINLALLNYYFRSKSKLFEIIMMETLQDFLQSMINHINNPETSLRDKIEKIINNYIELLCRQPNLPVFVLGELRNHPEHLVNASGMKKVLNDSMFVKQLSQHFEEKGIQSFSPIQIIMNIMGLTVFPFIASPIFKSGMGVSDQQFEQLIQQRKVLIPMWIDAILNIDYSTMKS